MCLSMPAGETGEAVGEQAQTEGILTCELYDWVEMREVLNMHGEKRTALGDAKRRAYNAKLKDLLK